MSDSVFASLAAQKGTRQLPGGRVIRNLLSEGLGVAAKVHEARANADLSPTGKAGAIALHIKTSALPTLAKAKAQRAYLADQFETEERNLRAKVAGAHDPLDGERRAVLRSATPEQRAELLRDPAMVQAAIRGGSTLSGLSENHVARLFDDNIAALAPPDALAKRANARDALEFVDAAIQGLQGAIENAPAAVNSLANGSLRPLRPNEIAAMRPADTELSGFDESVAEIVE